MHFDILVEGKSDKKALEVLIPKIISIGMKNTLKIWDYSGVGHIPRKLNPSGAKNKTLLGNLQKQLNGFGNTYAGYPPNYKAMVVVVCDLDDRDKENFFKELNDVLKSCSKKPQTLFCFAIEEGEAWFLGDANAIQKAYPSAKMANIKNYIQDSICGTWEVLADLLYQGGAAALSKIGYPVAGYEKCKWAENITPHMDVDINKSPSFVEFRDNIRRLAD